MCVSNFRFAFLILGLFSTRSKDGNRVAGSDRLLYFASSLPLFLFFDVVSMKYFSFPFE